MMDLGRLVPIARRAAKPQEEGRVTDVVGLVVEGRGGRAAIGDHFQVWPAQGGRPVEAEVVGLQGDRVLLMPLGETHGLSVGSALRRIGQAARARIPNPILGRVVDGLGRPLDKAPLPEDGEDAPLHGRRRNPLSRQLVDRPLGVGVRAIDACLTFGRGQRVGIFSGGGVGKSTLLGMIVRRTEADVCVIGLVGERGREVGEFVHRTLGPEGMRRSVVVAATSADPPLVRARGALLATAIAEHFRARGAHVLLLVDSLTRYAMALREIGLAVGEPPATKGYPPSVFAAMARLLERAGTNDRGGSITGIYTVLVEGDEMTDPIADAARAILDGHVVLSRPLAERGWFPAVDVLRSVSRVMPQVASARRLALAQRVRSALATHREAEDLLSIGAYVRGANPRLDDALAVMPALETLLRQGIDEPARLDALDEDFETALSAGRNP